MAKQWKAPYRPKGEITQPFESGVVTIYGVEDKGLPGRAPVEQATKKATLRYEERKLGIQRFYSGRQNQAEIERVIRIPRSVEISNQDVAKTEDGRWYRIDMVQAVIDVYPPSTDLTLARVSQDYNKMIGEEDT